MVLNTFIFTALSMGCPVPNFINKTAYPINAHDTTIIARTQERCGQLYPKSPCLKSLTKIGKQDYRAICTQKNRE